MKVFLKMTTGERVTLHVEASDIVDSVKARLQKRTGIPPDQVRLIFSGQQLADGFTLRHFKIVEESTLFVVLRLRGMISTFTADDVSDPLVAYLMLSDELRGLAQVPLDALHKKADAQASIAFQTFKFTREGRILSPKACAVLSSFLEFMWERTEAGTVPERVDMRARVDEAEFLKLLAVDANGGEPFLAENVLEDLGHAFRQIPGTPTSSGASKIAMRMTRGPSKACINFHCDGGYATGTVQIALNDQTEYKGGRLCFFVNGVLHVLERPVGSVCQHPRGVLHAVTALTEGTRKSLFVVDQSNGLGERGVVEVTSGDVQAFLETFPDSDESWLPSPPSDSASPQRRKRPYPGDG